ncbi:alpha/beta hydrolase [Paenibacillus sp. MBLB2552]|uniref:Alpha/beta hydrolase n=1 Tax=Paenibacillus mellifer TaxID=2937794 RepID=A0A9X1XX29_9BACL|nr:alpha/beta hydrolase [Paenibacillus mellifer]MCK8486894.1 alpha/beta hydrolase [Paenibacillus mellifer]
MIYWVTNTVGSAAQIYYENTHALPPLGYIAVPTALALFKADILPPPREWATRHLNVTRWTSMPRGGHFTAMEEPELMAEDIREFFRPFRTIRPAQFH